jgi:hypothetical protein
VTTPSLWGAVVSGRPRPGERKRAAVDGAAKSTPNDGIERGSFGEQTKVRARDTASSATTITVRVCGSAASVARPFA